MSEVYELGAHENMTVEEALTLCLREAQDSDEDEDDIDTIIISYYPDGDLRIRSSHMTNETANWILDKAKIHVMDVKQKGDDL